MGLGDFVSNKGWGGKSRPSPRPARVRDEDFRTVCRNSWLLIELGPGTCHNYLFNLAGKRTLWPLGPSHPQPAPLPRVGRQPIDKTPSGFIVGEIKNSQAGLCQSPGLPRPSLGSPHRGGRPPPSTLRRLLRPPPPRQTGAEPMCSEKTRRNPSRHKKQKKTKADGESLSWAAADERQA